MRKSLTVILLLAFAPLFAQENSCENALYSANKMYENGQFRQALDLLSPCVNENNLDGSEKFDATRLMALCYIYLNNSDSAETFVQRMLNIRSNYQEFHYVDPRQLTSVVNSYLVSRKVDVGLHVGGSWNQVNVLKNYSAAETSSTYSALFGLNAGILAEYYLNDRFSIYSDPNFNSMSYGREMDNVAGSKKEFTELITTVELPISCRYRFKVKGLNLFAQVGGQYNFWINSFADVQSTSVNDGSVIQSSTETTPYRKSGMYGYQIGLGFSVPTNFGEELTMSFRYRNFIPNFVVPETRYDNVDFILSSQYIDSDMSMFSWGVDLAYQFAWKHSVKKIK